jgi:hypothetical protein
VPVVIKRLAWVTTREARGRDDDEPLALAALERRGVDVDVIDWGDESAHWDSYDRVVLRSTWDYTQRLTEFLAWLDAVAEVTELINPAPLVRWNLDKHYLRELDLAKVAITSTTFVERGEEFVFLQGTSSSSQPLAQAVGTSRRTQQVSTILPLLILIVFTAGLNQS